MRPVAFKNLLLTPLPRSNQPLPPDSAISFRYNRPQPVLCDMGNIEKMPDS